MTPQHRTRTDVLDHGLALLGRGGTVSLDSVARAVGLTKPGLMYHFPTKEALMTALVDHLLDSHERALIAHLPEGAPTAHQRIRAYVHWSFSSGHDRTDLVMLSDHKLHDRLVSRWTERFSRWVDIPADIEPDQRARLLAARLLADGHWFAEAVDTFPLTPDERRRVRAVADDLIGEDR